MQPVQLQLITQHQTPMTSSAPPPVHLPPSKQQQQHINYQQTSIVNPPSSSTSPSASSNGSNHNGNVVNASPPMGGARDEENKIRDKCLYLKQLLQDKKQIQGLAGCFLHADRILDEEIVKVRSVLFQNGDKQPLELPSAQGATITLTEKVYVPVKDHPEYNFVGRLLGPRGLTAKQLEQETSCKIMVRGKGSMRDKKKEDSNRGKPNWEHLSDELHVLITVEDTENRARIKMDRALEEIQKLLVPTEGEDDLKKKQLMELAIINGTYRDYSMTAANQPRLIAAPPVLQGPQLRSPPAQGQPPINLLNNHILSRLPNGQHVITNGMTTQPPPMHITPSDGSLLYYTPTFEYPGTLTAPTFEYGLIDPSAILGQTAGGNKMFRPAPANQTQARVHPYQRPTATN